MSKKVYYDESCYVCSLEINAVRKRGESCGIEFVDISSSDFDPDGRDFESEMIGEFEGEQTTGPETFRRMYEEMGFKKSVCFSRLPVVRTAIDIGYHIFAYYIRPNLPKKKPVENTRDPDFVKYDGIWETKAGLSKNRSTEAQRDASSENIREPDFIDYDGMGNQGRFVNKEKK